MHPDLGKREKAAAIVLGLIAVTIIIVAAGCSAQVPHLRPEPAPDSSPSPVAEQGMTGETPTSAGGDPADWIGFEDPEEACSFNYPAGTTIETGTSPQGIHTIRLQFQISGVDGYQGMVIQVVPLSDSSDLDAILEQIYESSSQTLSLDEWLEALEPAAVGEMPGYRTTCSADATDFSVVIPRETRVFVITPSHDMAVTCADPEALSIFYRVLETFIIREDSDK